MEKIFVFFCIFLFNCDANLLSSYEDKNSKESQIEELRSLSNLFDSASLVKRDFLITKLKREKSESIKDLLIKEFDDAFIQSLLADSCLPSDTTEALCVETVNKILLDSIFKDTVKREDFTKNKEINQYVALLEDQGDVGSGRLFLSLDNISKIYETTQDEDLAEQTPRNILERIAELVLDDSSGNTNKMELQSLVNSLGDVIDIYAKIPSYLMNDDVILKLTNLKITRLTMNMGLLIMEDRDLTSFNFATDSLKSYYGNDSNPNFSSSEQLPRVTSVSDDFAFSRANSQHLTSALESDIMELDDIIDVDSNQVFSSTELENYVGDLVDD